jgi:hypothetical protein
MSAAMFQANRAASRAAILVRSAQPVDERAADGRDIDAEGVLQERSKAPHAGLQALVTEPIDTERYDFFLQRYA